MSAGGSQVDAGFHQPERDVIQPEEELFIDAKGLSMPSSCQAWGTKAFLVDGAQAQPTGDEAFIRRVDAVPMRVMFGPKEGRDQPMDAIDVLSYAEIDHVVNYMRMGMHNRVAAKKRRAMVTSPNWWDDKMLVTGKYEKDEFVARVMDHIADQYDGLVGLDPPTWDFPPHSKATTSQSHRDEPRHPGTAALESPSQPSPLRPTPHRATRVPQTPIRKW